MKTNKVLFVLLLLQVLLASAIQAETYEYDEYNRLSKVTYANGTTIEYFYDNAGNRLVSEIALSLGLAASLPEPGEQASQNLSRKSPQNLALEKLQTAETTPVPSASETTPPPTNQQTASSREPGNPGRGTETPPVIESIAIRGPVLDFQTNAAQLTNPYAPYRENRQWVFTGTGSFVGSERQILSEGSESIEGIPCLKVLVKGSEKEWYKLWLAQDSSKNVWLMQVYDTKTQATVLFGKEHPVLWMPAEPRIGEKIREMEGEYSLVEETDMEVDPLSTGLGPFTRCLKIKRVMMEGQDVDYIYIVPGIGVVKEEWNDQGAINGWELQELWGNRLRKDNTLAYNLRRMHFSEK